MRAMMSDQDARGGNGAGTLLQFTRAQQALDEATRLLARTEPNAEGTHMTFSALYETGFAFDLAEALATFVGEGN
jgi:hypothetical protein